MAQILRDVPADAVSASRIGHYLTWLNAERGHNFTGWDDLYAWSVTEIEDFWESVWDWFGIQAHSPYTAVLASRQMPHAQWFPGATLNYAEHSLGTPEQTDTVAVTAVSQSRDEFTLTFGELRAEVARVAAGLKDLGVGRGDRVAGYLPNQPEALVAFLATASLGAIWAACAPEFGTRSVVDRFSQVEPKVLFAVSGYRYGTKDIVRDDEVAEVVDALPTLTAVVPVTYGDFSLRSDLRDRFSGHLTVSDYADLGEGTDPDSLTFLPVPFDEPLVILFSSGTTGKPKAIVHGHGGILLETLKCSGLQLDLGADDVFCWFSTTAWMMWNTLVGALVLGSAIVMIDGNPNFPDDRELWRVAERTRATVFGMAPGGIMAAVKSGFDPASELDLSTVKEICSAGAPLPAAGYEWVVDTFGPGVLLNVGCGGTDVCTGILHATPLTPVYDGEMSSASLGFAAKAFDHDGNEIVDETGELVITEPVPSMPVTFWGADGEQRYRDAYFDKFPDVWRHGDWARFDSAGGVVVTGRSDATLNRGGVRLGTADFYTVVDALPGVKDCLVIHLEDPDGGMGKLVLFVQTDEGVALDDAMVATIRKELRTELSPRHMPDEVVGISAVPLGRTGKKLEVPVKRIVQGADPASVVTPGSLMDPHSLDDIVAYAAAQAQAQAQAQEVDA